MGRAENEARSDEARRNKPLRVVAMEHGVDWGSKVCPFCKDGKERKRQSAGFFEKGGRQWFKCHYTSCPTGGKALDEPGFIAQMAGLSYAEAWRAWLKSAGVWKEERLAPSVMPGQRARRKAPVETPKAAPEDAAPPGQDLTGGRGVSSTTEAAGSYMENRAGDPMLEGAEGSPVPEPVPEDGNEAETEAAEVGQAARPALESDGADVAGESGGGADESAVPGAGDPPRDAGPPADYDGDDPSWRRCLQVFWERTSLSDEDVMKLWHKRGLLPATSRGAGLRSSPRSNRAVLEALEKEFTIHELVQSGLWKRDDEDGVFKPNAQFFGMGIVRKLKRGEAPGPDEWVDEDRNLWGWCEPVLIPYFDEQGRVISIRPHKGGMKGKPALLYVVRMAEEESGKRKAESGKPASEGQTSNIEPVETAIVTEGEFKALALWQVLGAARHVQSKDRLFCFAAVPGISQTKPRAGGWWVRDGLRTLLTRRCVKQVIVAYDNEEKGDRRLPGFKADAWNRYDTHVWARYLAEELTREGYPGRVCVLPNEWRDENGKADWDGALRMLMDRVWRTRGKAAPEDAAPPAEVWSATRVAVRNEFLAALKQARPVWELRQLFLFGDARQSERAEKTITKKLAKVSYVPKMPAGGDEEEGYAAKLTTLLHRARREEGLLDPAAVSGLWSLAGKYRETRGCYYLVQPPKTKAKWDYPIDLPGHWMQSWQHRRDEAADPMVKWACELMMRGMPKVISDFSVDPFYILVKETGEYIRLVRLKNVHFEEWDLLELDADSFSQPSKWRVWLLKQTNTSFEAGEREIQAIQRDLGAQLAHELVYEVSHFGWHAPDPATRLEPAGLWFFDDVAIGSSPEGELVELLPKRGIFRYGGKKYKLSERDQEGQAFRRGRPKMQPEVKATTAEVAALLRDMAGAMWDTLGGPEGYMVLGATLSCAFAPELFEEHHWFPGLWLPGETGQGKSTMAVWMQALWGLMKTDGLNLPNSTKVGVGIALQQYSNLPVWLEEFQPSVENKQDWPAIVEMIKTVFNRESGSKKTFEEMERRVRCVALVTGVATAADAQVKSRYVHAQVSARKRIGDHLQWMEDNKGRFFLVGREVLRHRMQMVAGVKRRVREFMQSAAEQGVTDPRARGVHGVPYASWLEICDWFAQRKELIAPPDRLEAFRKFMVRHAVESSAVVSQQVNVNLFWRLLLTAWRSGYLGDGYQEWRNFMRAQVLTELKPALGENLDPELRAGWRNYRLHFRPGDVIGAVNRFLIQQKMPTTLTQSDLQAQMSQRDYWVRGPLKYRFGQDMSALSCWAVDLDRHEMGRQAVSPEELEQSLRRMGENGVEYYYGPSEITSGKWTDPRKGDLYALVHAVEDRESDRNLGDEHG